MTISTRNNTQNYPNYEDDLVEKKGLKVSKAALLGSIIIKYSDKNNGATARNRLDLIGGSVISPKNGTCSRNWNFRTA